MKKPNNVDSVKSTPATYGKNHAVTKTKAQLIKLDENSGNMTMNAYHGKVKELANEIHQSLEKATDKQMAFILEKVAKRGEHGFQWLTGNEKKLNIDKVLKLNVNLTSEQMASIDKAIATRKELSKGGKNPIKKAASNLLGSQHSELLDLPKLRYGKGSELKMITESVCDTNAIKKLASGKVLLGIAG
jgi:G:T/U-mismatch repair DNA glycosylase|tara:strand:- start:316 stop:879 length:564 start_codon:yes stop_codon:yes gene_type:complete